MLSLPHKMTTSWTGWIISLFLLNVFIKVLPVLQGVMIHPDAPVYLWAAQSLEKGNFQEAVQAYPMLFYPFLIKSIHQLGIDWLAAGRTISFVSSSLAVFPFFFLARRFLPGWSSYFVTLLFIFLPQYNSIAFAAIRDPLYICLAFYCLYFAIEFLEQPALKRFFPFIIFSLCLPFLRVEGILVSLVLWGWSFVIFSRRLDPPKKIWSIIIFAGFLCAVFFFCLVSETGRQILRLPDIGNYIEYLGSPETSVNRYLAKLDDLAQHHRVSGHGNNLWQVMQRHLPLIFGIGMLYMFVEVLGWPLVLLGFFGLQRMCKAGSNGWLFIVLFVASQSLILAKYMITGSMEERIMLFPAMLWLFIAGMAFEPLAEWVAAKFSFPIQRPTLLTVICLAFLLNFVYKTVTMDFRIHVPVLQTSCSWIKSNLLSDGKNWQIQVSSRRMQWFLDKKDAQIIGERSVKKIHKFLLSGSSPKLVVLLLNTRKEEETTLKEQLLKQTGILTKVFTGNSESKYFAVACWNGK